MLILLDSDSYFGLERHQWAWAIGTAFALSAFLISLVLIYKTFYHNHSAPLRRYVILVLFMIPVYSVCAWLGLVLKDQSAYWDLVRDCYESLAIWAFFSFLTSYLGGAQHMAVLMSNKEPHKHIVRPTATITYDTNIQRQSRD